MQLARPTNSLKTSKRNTQYHLVAIFILTASLESEKQAPHPPDNQVHADVNPQPRPFQALPPLAPQNQSPAMAPQKMLLQTRHEHSIA